MEMGYIQGSKLAWISILKLTGAVVMNNYTAKTTVFVVIFFAVFGKINLNFHLSESILLHQI